MSGEIKVKGFKEIFAQFLEDPSREAFRELMVHQVGELNQLDFKTEWPDPPSLSKHILAIANSKGGCIVFGVQDKNWTPVGLPELIDKTVWKTNVRKFIPEQLNQFIESYDISYDASEYPTLIGKSFQILFIDDEPSHIPFIAQSESKGIRKNGIYVRSDTASVEASYEDLQRLLDRKLNSAYPKTSELELQEHINQLRVLYKQIAKTATHTRLASIVGLSDIALTFRKTLGYEDRPNPNYPEEDFEEFILRAIGLKKDKILSEIGIA